MTDTDTAPPASDAPPADTPDASQAAGKPDTGNTDAAKLLAEAQAEAEKWRGLARKHEERAKANADAATKAKTTEQQLEELRQQIEADRAKAGERNARLALSQVKARLAEDGIKAADADGLLALIDAGQLLKDGEPDDKAIANLAASLSKIAGRAAPDPDQGRGTDKAPADMNSLIRRAAGFGG